MDGTEQQTRERLENIRSVEPIVNALRTIAMGNWKAAMARRKRALEFDRRIGGLLAEIPGAFPAAGPGSARAATRVTALAVGSERGLCGAFNRMLAERTGQYLKRAAERGERVRLQAAGSSAVRAFERMGIRAERLRAASAAALPSLALADALARGWLAAYEADETDRVDVLYNAYLGAGRFEPRVWRLIPPQLTRTPAAGLSENPFPPILQTDPAGLIARVAVQQVTARLYACLLESAAVENSARYQLMEDARQNIDRLTAELEAEAVQAHRQSITREIQNLAVGSGLLAQSQ
jgi:F-type H+-transporting ATPase subunit gamma